MDGTHTKPSSLEEDLCAKWNSVATVYIVKCTSILFCECVGSVQSHTAPTIPLVLLFKGSYGFLSIGVCHGGVLEAGEQTVAGRKLRSADTYRHMGGGGTGYGGEGGGGGTYSFPLSTNWTWFGDIYIFGLCEPNQSVQ